METSSIWQNNHRTVVISPYTQFPDFAIHGSIDGKDIELAEISEQVRRKAHVRYKIKFEESCDSIPESMYSINGRARPDLLRPTQKDASVFEQLLEDDDGERFFQFLAEQKQAERFNLKRSPQQTVVCRILIGQEVSRHRQAPMDRKEPPAIGALSGSRIYRDGFGVRADRDWLGLGKQWTGGGSYCLNPLLDLARRLPDETFVRAR